MCSHWPVSHRARAFLRSVAGFTIVISKALAQCEAGTFHMPGRPDKLVSTSSQHECIELCSLHRVGRYWKSGSSAGHSVKQAYRSLVTSHAPTSAYLSSAPVFCPYKVPEHRRKCISQPAVACTSAGKKRTKNSCNSMRQHASPPGHEVFMHEIHHCPGRGESSLRLFEVKTSPAC